MNRSPSIRAAGAAVVRGVAAAFVRAAGAAVIGGAAAALPAQQITLPQAIDMALKQSHGATAAAATLDGARANARAFYARRLPQMSLAANAPIFTKDIQAAPQPDGSLEFLPVQQTQADAGLRIDQQLPWTGAGLQITSSLRRVDQTRQSVLTRTWTGTPVSFSISQPILRPNFQRWEGRVQHLDLDIAERQFLEAREGVALAATEAFFELYIAKRQLDNAVVNAATNDTLYNLNKGRLEIGKIGENDLLQSELALLRARAALDNAKLEFERRLAGFRLAVNLPAGAPVEVVVPTNIPTFEPDTTIAVAQALRNRAQVSELELQSVQARRQIANAKLGGGPGATLVARFGYNQIPGDSLLYRDLLQSQGLSLALSIPVFNWGARSADVQEARVNQKRVEATNQHGRRQLELDARFAALQLSQARRNLAVSAKADTVAAKRFEVAYNRYIIGKIGIDNLFIGQNEKDQAVTQYLQALRNYWLAYYRLRQTTLYDFEAGTPIR
jgi:outer membrane protein